MKSILGAGDDEMKKTRHFLARPLVHFHHTGFSLCDILARTAQRNGPQKDMFHQGHENKRDEVAASEHSRQSHGEMTHGQIGYPPVPWADPRIPISPPPRLMGKQMGKVHTLNMPPLGYETYGSVKAFTLIAQPVKRLLTVEKMPDDTIIEPQYRFKTGIELAPNKSDASS